MIHPNIKNFTKRALELATRKVVSVLSVPLQAQTSKCDRGYIDQIRNQPKPNEISKKTTSIFKTDITQMVKLLGSFCKKNSLQEVTATIKEIHETLNSKEPPEVKNWVRLLTGLHPVIDNQIKGLGYWKKPYSEVIGTNTILYYAEPQSVDITKWTQSPTILNNTVITPSFDSPQYIRETTRHKLDSEIVELVQNAGHLTTKYLTRNLIWEAGISTEKNTGSEKTESRPISPSVCHGVSLNNDWYHSVYRITQCRSNCKTTAINYLKDGGYNVQYLVNHLTPLINENKAQGSATRFEAPLGIEETFPRRPTNLKADIDNSGQKVLKSPDGVNNNIIKPEIIQGE